MCFQGLRGLTRCKNDSICQHLGPFWSIIVGGKIVRISLKPRGLWFLVIATAFVLNVWPLLGPRSTIAQPTFFSFLEKHYRILKQSIQRLASWERRSPSRDILIYRIDLPFRSQLLLNPELKKKIVQDLSQHRGLIFSDIDPDAIRQDPVLRNLLKQKNFVRDFRLMRGLEKSPELQEQMASKIGSQAKLEIPRGLKIRPSDEDYYDPSYLYGTSTYVKDLRSHFIQDYPLSVLGEEYRLPTMLSIYWDRAFECSGLQIADDRGVLCSNQKMKLSDPLPLHFYESTFMITKPGQKIANPDAVLIVEVYDEGFLFTTPTANNASWAELFATAVSNIQQKHFLKSPSWIPWWELFLFVILSLLIFFGSVQFKLKTLIPLTLGAYGFFILIDVLFTVFFRLQTQPIPELFSLAAVSLVALTTRAIQDFEDRSKLERAFSGYLSEQRLERVLKGEESLQLNGRRTELAILILDIAGFSKLSQSISAEEAFQLMRDFFSIVDPIIFKHGGFIDKKMGDGLIAVFGDDLQRKPSAAVFSGEAIAAALEIQEQVKRVKVRIGINTGMIMIGNSGSKQHFNYTVVGEAVNFTQRLEAACPVGSVLVGPKVEELTREQFSFAKREISVKGESNLFEAYQVLERRL